MVSVLRYSLSLSVIAFIPLDFDFFLYLARTSCLSSVLVVLRYLLSIRLETSLPVALLVFCTTLFFP